MWWIIWGAVTILGFVLDKITSFYLAGFAMKYLGVAALMVLAIGWLNSTNRRDK